MSNDFGTLSPQVLRCIQGELEANACSHSSTFSFIKGFMLGQLSVIVVVVLALRYLLMEDMKRVKKRYIPSHLSSAPPSRANAAAASQLPAAYIASKTYYDFVHHPPESTDWLNVLIAQAIMQYRDDAQINNRLMLAVDEVLNDGVRPSFLRAEIDFEYNDQITLGIETQAILNWPRQAFAALPVSLVLSVVRFSGTLTIELINPPETTAKPEKPLERYIAISSYSDFVLDMNVRSLIGSRTKLEDIPKLTDLITTKLRNLYIDKLVYPTFVKVKVPNMWEQRDKKTQERLDILGKEDSTSTSGIKPGAKEKIEELVKDIKSV
ncbi:ERMES complex subunit mmm1 [Apophysomyces ossiformis]|uniref:Maintenance of mitochondrial morphology protein 1 n=1 Tax=Apophysomyces ossiformis TaxID=679940 RepID=A0A8H7ELV6_9FUNG|nr:ERMES complex subunit mmm1 [Apophysomyces ossiformis]